MERVMTYFVPQTVDDIMEMKERGDSENAMLEFKSCRLFTQKNDKVFETLAKEITAFANSIGGVLIIGIEEDNDRVISEVVPITDQKKNESWIEDGLLPRITPSLYFSVARIEINDGYLLVINVPASRNAPHQSSDKRYYARRLFRVDQLLAFEIDDIRRRTVDMGSGASLSVLFISGEINFQIENTGIGPVYDISVSVDKIDNEAISNQWTPKLNRPYTEPFKIIHSKEKRSFPGAGFQFFQDHVEDRMDVTLCYTDEDEKQHKKSYTYYLKDFDCITHLKTPQEQIVVKGVQNLEKMEQTLSNLSRDIQVIKESAFLPSGLNLSKTTLSVLAGEKNTKWPGSALSLQALAEILEVDVKTAHEIQQTLFGSTHFIGGESIPLEKTKFPDDVKEKILQRLIL